MDSPQILYGYSIDSPQILYGYSIDSPQILYGYPKDALWILYGWCAQELWSELCVANCVWRERIDSEGISADFPDVEIHFPTPILPYSEWTTNQFARLLHFHIYTCLYVLCSTLLTSIKLLLH